jgi:hypothetical protein
VLVRPTIGAASVSIAVTAEIADIAPRRSARSGATRMSLATTANVALESDPSDALTRADRS